MSRPEKISVLVTSWNGRQHLETCLAALAEQHHPGVPWEVLVLDNGSRDGTPTWLRRAHPEVRLVESRVNVGFCAANNRLAGLASGDALALLNNDTRPQRAWLGELYEALAASPPEVAAVSGLIVDWEGERLDFAEGLMTFDGHALQRDFRRPLSQAAVPDAGAELLFACGGNMLVRREEFLAAGGFDDDYFAYYEDVDLGWRLRAAGRRIRCAPRAVVHHRSSATSDLLGLFNRGFLFERNAFLTAYKNYDAELWGRIMPAVVLTLLARTQALLVTNNPGGEQLAIDPYAGHIADTAQAAAVDSEAESLRHRLAALSWEEVRQRGIGELLRGAARRLRGRARRGRGAAPVVSDERSQSQLRAISFLVGHLDGAAEKRALVQSRRQVEDREIFARFPLYLVPTYPGDEALFGGAGFRSWLPSELPLVEARLDELMEIG